LPSCDYPHYVVGFELENNLELATAKGHAHKLKAVSELLVSEAVLPGSDQGNFLI